MCFCTLLSRIIGLYTGIFLFSCYYLLVITFSDIQSGYLVSSLHNSNNSAGTSRLKIFWRRNYDFVTNRVTQNHRHQCKTRTYLSRATSQDALRCYFTILATVKGAIGLRSGELGGQINTSKMLLCQLNQSRISFALWQQCSWWKRPQSLGNTVFTLRDL